MAQTLFVMRTAWQLAVASVLSSGIAGLACRDATAPDGQARIVWHVPSSDFGGAPVARDTTVFFPASSHQVVAVDTRTGVVRWRAATGEGGQSATAGANVVVAGSVVVVPDVRLHAYDAATGAARWVFEPVVGHSPGFFNLSSDGAHVFAGSPSGYAYGVDAFTGSQLWATRIATDSVTTNVIDPVVDQGVVFVTMRRFTNPSSGGVVALDAATGEIRWRREFTPSAAGQGAGSGGRVAIWHDLVLSSADDGRVYGLNRATGAIVWTSARPADEVAFNDQRPVILAGEVLVVGSDRPRLTGLEPGTGAQRWEVGARNGSVNYPLASDGTRVYVTDASLGLSAFDAATGTLVWSVTATAVDGGIVPYPYADATQLYVSGVHGFWALKR